MKIKAFKTLILMITVLLCTVKAYGEAEVGLNLETEVPPTVAIEKVSAQNVGNIKASTGVHSGMSATYSIQTNNPSTQFILRSEIETSGGTVNAFGPDGRLLFGNIDALPTPTAVANAMAQTVTGANYNVIAYPFSVDAGSMSVSIGEVGVFGNCWKIDANGITAPVTLTQSVGSTPSPKTYELGGDSAGKYQATVIITVAEN